MTIAISQGVSAEATIGSNTPTTLTAGINTGATGSSFLIVTCEYSASLTTVTDTFSNSYSLLTSQVTGSRLLSVYLCTNGSGGTAHKPTLTKSAGDVTACCFGEVTGGATTSLTDGTAGTALDSSSPFNATVTTTNPVDLVITAGSCDGASNPVTYTPGSGFTLHSTMSFTNGANSDSIGIMYQRVTSTGTYGGNFTTSSGTNTAVITFALKEFAGVNTTITPPVGSDTVSGNTPTVTSGINTVIQTFVARHGSGILEPDRRLVRPDKRIFLPYRKAA